MSSTNPSFIGEYYIDEKFCDELVDFFNATPFQREKTDPKRYYTKVEGQIGTFDQRTDTTIKDSTDLTLNHNLFFSNDLPPEALPFCHIAHKYIEYLRPCIDEYGKEYEHSQETVWQIKEGINLQHYAPGQGYHHLHCERQGTSEPFCWRHLVFMTYLNTVTDGGETWFKYQNKKVKAVKGKTVIWPSDWTHMHKGIVSPTQDKYIMTGWISHTNPDDVWVPNTLKGLQLTLDL